MWKYVDSLRVIFWLNEILVIKANLISQTKKFFLKLWHHNPKKSKKRKKEVCICGLLMLEPNCEVKLITQTSACTNGKRIDFVSLPLLKLMLFTEIRWDIKQFLEIIYWFSPQMPTVTEMWLGWSWECSSGPLQGWQEFGQLRHPCCFLGSALARSWSQGQKAWNVCWLRG